MLYGLSSQVAICLHGCAAASPCSALAKHIFQSREEESSRLFFFFIHTHKPKRKDFFIVHNEQERTQTFGHRACAVTENLGLAIKDLIQRKPRRATENQKSTQIIPHFSSSRHLGLKRAKNNPWVTVIKGRPPNFDLFTPPTFVPHPLKKVQVYIRLEY